MEPEKDFFILLTEYINEQEEYYNRDQIISGLELALAAQKERAAEDDDPDA